MEKIYPTEDELSLVETPLQCSELGCNSIFKSKSNLNFHLLKHHKNKSFQHLLEKKLTQNQYICPVSKCIYNSSKSFKNMKYLKQHYLKVHSEKNHTCSKCSLSFAAENMKNAHEEYCGIIFKCPKCTVKYTSYDTLTTHARRKGHKIYAKSKYKALFLGDTSACSKIVCVLDKIPNVTISKPLLLPKSILNNSSMNSIKSINREIDISSSNDNTVQTTSKRQRKNKTSETQTQKFKVIKSTVCTQTEQIAVSSMTNNIDNSSKKSIKTQTAAVTSSSRACNTSFDLNYVDDGYFDVEKSSLGTQTLSPSILENAVLLSSQNNNINKSTTSTQVNDNSEDILQYINDNSFCNSNMETQTDWLEEFNLLSNDVYSNNYTQTCNELLPPDLQFNDIHTQTIFNDILRSVGSQTNMRSNVFMSNTETQTDLIFKELLQEINS